MQEKTLIIIKPDAVQRGLVGEIFCRFEKRGFKLIASKFMRISHELAQKHYVVHEERPFFGRTCEYIASSPSMVMVWEGDDIIRLSRIMIGATAPADALPGTIRGDFGLTKGYNLVHGSDSQEAVDYEIPLYFTPQELIDYNRDITPWLLGND